MITEERTAVRAVPQRGRAAKDPALEDRSFHEAPRPRPQPQSGDPGLLWRVILVMIGSIVALTGWFLILSVFFSFIGLPMFFFGLALMQSQE